MRVTKGKIWHLLFKLLKDLSSLIFFFWFISCSGNTSTDQILNGDIIPSDAYSYQVTAPAFIQVGQTFTIELKVNVYHNTSVDYSGTPTISILGDGTILAPTNVTFSAGIAHVDVTYTNNALVSGSTTSFYLSASDNADSKITGMSGIITAGMPAFTVTTPGIIESGVAFMVTMTVTLNGQSYAGYTNSLNITASGAGSFTVNSTPVFSNGLAQVSVVYTNPALVSGSTETIFINVQDSINTAMMGSSTAALVGKTSLAISAPQSVESGVAFNIIITANSFGTPNAGFNRPVSLGMTGSGTLTLINAGPFSAGSATYTIIIEDQTLATGGSSTVFLSAADTQDPNLMTVVNTALIVGKTSLVIVAPQFAEVGASFNITISAKFLGGANTAYNHNVNLSITGDGTLNVISSASFSGGSIVYTVSIDNPALAAGATSTVFITAIDNLDASIAATSGALTVGTPSYNITAPAFIESDVPFTIAIDVTLNGSVYSSYTSSLNITTSGVGTLALNTPLVFSGGSATVSLTYSSQTLASGGTETIFITAQDSLLPSMMGSSSSTLVGKTMISMSVPTSLEVGVPFNLTLNATLFGSAISAYTHAVTLGLAGGGSLTVTSSGVFSGATATYAAVYTNNALTPGATATIFITAIDASDTTITTTSPPITVGKRGFNVSAPAGIQSGNSFNVTVTAVLYGVINSNYSSPITLTKTGGIESLNGALSVITPGTFINGVATYTLQYNYPLPLPPLGTIEQFQITVTETGNTSNTAQSSSIQAGVAVTLAGFTVQVPTTTYVNQLFTMRITAIGTDAQIWTTYNGTININTSVDGVITGALYDTNGLPITSASGFVNGILNLTVKYVAQEYAVKVNVADSADAGKTGHSLGMSPFGDTFAISGAPVDSDSDGTMDTVRLSFTVPQNTYLYKVYRNYILLGMITVASATSYTENGLAVSVTPYDYVVQVFDVNNVKLAEGSTSVILKNCTTINTGVGDTITTNTSWTIANSPYCVNSPVTVSGTSTVLTIEPGVQMLFAATGGITVSAGASINSTGSPGLPIVYTTNAAAPIAGSWNGITIASTAEVNSITVTKTGNEVVSETNGATGSRFLYSDFSYAKTAITSNVPIWVEYTSFTKNDGSANSGGIYILTGTSNYSVIRNNMFNQNSGKTGDIRAAVSVAIRSNSFYKSYGYDPSGGLGGLYAGSVYIYGTNSSTVFGNTFLTTTGTFYAGALFAQNSNNVIRKNRFEATKVVYSGPGAISINGGSGSTITENTFIDVNSPDQSAIYIGGNNNMVTSNQFIRTISNNNGSYSVGNITGGAIYVKNTSNLIISNNYFEDTLAGGSFDGLGGAVYVMGSATNLLLNNNTFIRSKVLNAAPTGGAYGGAIHFASPTGSGIGVHYNHFLNTQAGALGADGAKGGAISIMGAAFTTWAFWGNSCVGATINSTTPNCFYSQETESFALDSWWWGGQTLSDPTVCTTGLCETTIASTPTITNTLAAAPTLCCTNPAAPNCVGSSIIPDGGVCQ